MGPQRCLEKAAKLLTSSKHHMNTSFQVKWLLQDKQSPALNTVLLRLSPGPEMGCLRGQRPAQVTKEPFWGLRLVAGDIGQRPILESGAA